MLPRRTGAVCSGEIEIVRAVSRNSATFGRQWQETVGLLPVLVGVKESVVLFDVVVAQGGIAQL
jgi:hypothetical protein